MGGWTYLDGSELAAQTDTDVAGESLATHPHAVATRDGLGLPCGGDQRPDHLPGDFLCLCGIGWVGWDEPCVSP